MIRHRGKALLRQVCLAELRAVVFLLLKKRNIHSGFVRGPQDATGAYAPLRRIVRYNRSAMNDTVGAANGRKIIHVDMDAFYASVEQRDHPDLRGKPVVVGGAPNRRGVVAACSYEARAFGIRSAMSSTRAARLCPQAVFLKPRFAEYRRISAQIMAVFKKFTAVVEPLSLDEAYLDVSACDQFQGSATRIAQAVKAEVRRATGLTASAGVSYNKFLAKAASAMDKPDGLYVITPAAGADFVARLPISRFFGVGKATEARMKALGVADGADLRRLSLAELRRHFGKIGEYFYHVARGIDRRPVRARRERKSVSNEVTFLEDLSDTETMLRRLCELAEETLRIMERKQLLGRTLTIKVKYADFQQVTRSRTLAEPIVDVAAIEPVLAELLAKTEAGARRVRLLGAGVSNLQPAARPQEVRQASLL